VDIIVLNAHASAEEESDDSKDSFLEELEVFNHFNYHMKILLGDFNLCHTGALYAVR
jgi:hypothetical protein